MPIQKSSCKSERCKRAIIWAALPDGGSVPLDPAAPVYRIREDGVAVRVVDYFVTHFATCRDPNQFSGRKKAAPEALDAHSAPR